MEEFEKFRAEIESKEIKFNEIEKSSNITVTDYDYILFNSIDKIKQTLKINENDKKWKTEDKYKHVLSIPSIKEHFNFYEDVIGKIKKNEEIKILIVYKGNMEKKMKQDLKFALYRPVYDDTKKEYIVPNLSVNVIY